MSIILHIFETKNKKMNKTNKIILKHLLPGAIIVTVSASAMLGLFGYAATTDEVHYSAQNKNAVPVNVLIVLLGLCFILCILADSYNTDTKFASQVARKFLKQTIQEHPEIKELESVLNNQKALKTVTTMISNSLRPSEQERILYIANELLRKTQNTDITGQEKVMLTKKAYSEIIKIIKEHAAVHPDFINEIYATMARAETTFVMPTQQHTR